MPPSPTEMLSLKETAQALAVSEKTARRMIARGDLEGVRLGPRLIRVKRASLEALGVPLGARAR